MKDTKECENNAQTARKGLGNSRTGSKNRSKESREFGEQGANRSKETREFENKVQTARKRPGNLRTRSKPLDRARYNSRTMRKLLEGDCGI